MPLLMGSNAATWSNSSPQRQGAAVPLHGDDACSSKLSIGHLVDLHTSAGRTRRRRQTDTSNTAQSLRSEINRYTPVPLSSLQKQGGHMALRTELLTQVNKTLWNKTHVQECKLK
ncbi:hypothetical protein fugu_011243 [Takifugu bimaculatus]|uniref:Uncharacterized protein n=1 Tax=Takifugu bimaculatus TaxID=433685 RepID=A0A4Z2CCJ5_9TELE|nr:hypothetical protein fugu_011243 [Takifugu bimaculatus]